MAPKATKIELSADQQKLLERQLKIGSDETVSDVIDHAFELLDEHNTAMDEVIREKVKQYLANPSPGVPIDEVFERLEAHHALRVKTAKRSA